MSDFGDALDKSERMLNTEGDEGWEAVALLPKSAVLPKAAGADCIALMKRPKNVAQSQP